MNPPTTMTNFAIIIPAYNESNTILSVIEKSLAITPSVIVINDASSDDTAQKVSHTKAILLNHAENKGKASALINGFEYALQHKFDFVITLDGDGQHRPEDIPDLIQAYEKDQNTLVIAARLKHRENSPKARLIANKIADFWVSWAASAAIVDSQSGFRLYPIALISHMKNDYVKSQGFVFESEILIDASQKGFSFVFVPIDSYYPEQRRASHFRPVFDITQITLMVAKKLFAKAFNLAGLKRALTTSPNIYIKEKNELRSKISA